MTPHRVILLANLEMLVGHTNRRLRDREAVVDTNGEPNRLGGLEVDDQLELRRLFNEKVAGLRTLEDLVQPELHEQLRAAIERVLDAGASGSIR